MNTEEKKQLEKIRGELEVQQSNLQTQLINFNQQIDTLQGRKSQVVANLNIVMGRIIQLEEMKKFIEEEKPKPEDEPKPKEEAKPEKKEDKK